VARQTEEQGAIAVHLWRCFGTVLFFARGACHVARAGDINGIVFVRARFVRRDELMLCKLLLSAF